jgi:membrane protease subunit (stomatin/prohibitin family)
LSGDWQERRGIQMASFTMPNAVIPEEHMNIIRDFQQRALLTNPNMAAATLVGAQAEAMKSAASNESTGPMMAFAGMNMAAGAGGMNAGNLFQMGQQQQQSAAPAAAAGWTCACGQTGNTGKFCSECAKPNPAAAGWTCSCGTVNKGKFCSECAKPKPSGVPQYKCDKCGWEPEDPTKPPKFCPECADPFDTGDIKA